MRIAELTESSDSRLAALAQLLKGRLKDTGADQSISADAFVKMAQGLGMALNKNTLASLLRQPPLSNLISSLDGDVIHFRGEVDSDEADTPEIDAEAEVERMAKRQMNK